MERMREEVVKVSFRVVSPDGSSKYIHNINSHCPSILGRKL
jgi:hypothetical protein